jgi:hypothetical protein
MYPVCTNAPLHTHTHAMKVVMVMMQPGGDYRHRNGTIGCSKTFVAFA